MIKHIKSNNNLFCAGVIPELWVKSRDHQKPSIPWSTAIGTVISDRRRSGYHVDHCLLHSQLINKYYVLVGFVRAWTPVRCAHPYFWAHCYPKRGAARPPLPIAASLLLIQPPKIYKIYPTWAAHVKGFFLSTGPQRLWNMRAPATRSAHRRFADPSGNILGSKLCTGATIRPNFFGFSFFL